MEMPAKQAGVARLSRVVRLFYLDYAKSLTDFLAGAWGWVRLGIACGAGRCREGE